MILINQLLKESKKTKNILTSLIVLSDLNLFAQNNCNLINSATFSVPFNSVIGSYGKVSYVNDTINPYYMPMDIGQWQYIAITKDNNNQARIYKNGQLVYSGTYANNPYSWNRLDLGAVFFTSYSGWFNGNIDEIRISNIVLEHSENDNYLFTS